MDVFSIVMFRRFFFVSTLLRELILLERNYSITAMELLAL